MEYQNAKLDKIILVGTYKEADRIRPLSIFCRIVVDKEGVLCVTGVISPFKSGHAAGGCGQIDMEFAHRDSVDNSSLYANPIQPTDITYKKDWSAEKWLTLLDIWKAWHLRGVFDSSKQEALPQDVLEFLSTLPKAARQPAWI